MSFAAKKKTEERKNQISGCQRESSKSFHSISTFQEIDILKRSCYGQAEVKRQMQLKKKKDSNTCPMVVCGALKCPCQNMLPVYSQK